MSVYLLVHVQILQITTNYIVCFFSVYLYIHEVTPWNYVSLSQLNSVTNKQNLPSLTIIQIQVITQHVTSDTSILERERDAIEFLL